MTAQEVEPKPKFVASITTIEGLKSMRVDIMDNEKKSLYCHIVKFMSKDLVDSMLLPALKKALTKEINPIGEAINVLNLFT